MKAIITVLFISFILISTCGQKKPLTDSTRISIESGSISLDSFSLFEFRAQDSLENSISLVNDTTVEIYGDTVTAVRFIMRELSKAYNKLWDCEKRFDTAKYIYWQTKYKNELHW